MSSDKKSECFSFQTGQKKDFFQPQLQISQYQQARHKSLPWTWLLALNLRNCDEASKFFLLKCLPIWKYPWNFLLFKYFKSLVQNNIAQHRLHQNIYVREKWDRKHLNIYFFEHFQPPLFLDLTGPLPNLWFPFFLRQRPQLAKLSPQLCSP